MIPTGWLWLECLACFALGWVCGRERTLMEDEKNEERVDKRDQQGQGRD